MLHYLWKGRGSHQVDILKMIKPKYSFLLSLLLSMPVSAADRYTDSVYTSATILYWCTYKKIPSSKKDLSKLSKGYLLDTEIDPELELDYNIWLDSLSYNIENNELVLIKQSKVVTGGNFQSTLTSESRSNCKSLITTKSKPQED